jgi:hypothetical protein
VLRGRITWANVVSSLALFVAIGGVSWAAVTLPKNSVGGSKIKKNAVTGVKVKDKSLKPSDFAPGALQAGVGPAGPAGPVGPAGATGDKGDAGPEQCSELLCRDTDVDGHVDLTLNGATVAPGFSAYTVNCPDTSSCTMAIAGRPSRNIELDAWFEGARLAPNDPAWNKDFSLNVYDQDGNVAQRWHVTHGHPSAITHLPGRMQVKFTAQLIEPVSL